MTGALRALRVEDLLLTAGVLLGTPLGQADGRIPGGAIGGLIAVLAVLGAIICLATRAPGDPPRALPRLVARRDRDQLKLNSPLARIRGLHRLLTT